MNIYVCHLFQALFDAHDQVAAKDFLPQLPDIAHEVDEDEESVKVVRLVKGNKEPLVRISFLVHSY